MPPFPTIGPGLIAAPPGAPVVRPAVSAVHRPVRAPAAPTGPRDLGQQLADASARNIPHAAVLRSRARKAKPGRPGKYLG